MYSIQVFDQFSSQIRIDGFLNILDIGQDRLNTTRSQAVMRALPHTTRHQHLAIADCIHHPGMAVLGLSVHTVHVSLLAVMVVLSGKLTLMHFWTCFLLGHFSILHSQDHIITSLPEMCRDGFLIIGYNCDLHRLTPLKK